jgi:hypothetical protein
MNAPQHPSPRRRRVTFLALALALVVLGALPASAWAGRVLVTGHDADLHCSGGSIDSGQCHYVAVALAYARGGAPTPSRKVLALDKGGLVLDSSLTSLGIPHDTVDPTSPAFASTPLSTDTYSAIVVASDASCGGCDLNDTSSGTPDSDAINARASAIAAFFNAGGGVVAFAGADHGDGNPSSGPDTYYSFIPVPVGGAAVASPFTLTAAGRAIGLEDQRAGIGTHDDINCCATHNSFTQPGAGSALQSAENDSQGLAETLIASGQISGGQLVSGALPPPVLAKTVNVATLRGTVYVSVPARSAFASLAVPGIKGRRFVPLTSPRQIPVGALLDTRKGTIALGSASAKAGQFFTGTFSGGVFAALQSRSGLTSLPLKGSSFRSCTARAGRASAALSRRVIRRMRSSASGRFRTSGRYSAATVRGTIWQTIDRCDGTLTKVTRGTVVVRDFRKRRNITVRAGKSYLARAPG